MSGGLDWKARAADGVAKFIGSWRFVIGQAAILALWFILNGMAWSFSWDPYPFILANLFMSAEAAFATPLLLMSQNRSAEADRQVLHKDLAEDRKTNQMLERLANGLGVDITEESNAVH